MHALKHTPTPTRERERDRQTDRQTDRDADRETERERDRQRQTDRDRESLQEKANIIKRFAEDGEKTNTSFVQSVPRPKPIHDVVLKARPPEKHVSSADKRDGGLGGGGGGEEEEEGKVEVGREGVENCFPGHN